MKQVKTAVFPIAGMGTRFLPATKILPKEMLTIVDKPLIQYAYDEAVNAGIERFIFITGRNKEVIENHFDRAFEMETSLRHKNKIELVERINNLPQPGSVCFIRQQEPLGLGHAIWCARHYIREPFAVILPDVLLADSGYLTSMIRLYEKTQSNIVALSEVAAEQVSSYGIVAYKESSGKAVKITGMVEKPSVQQAPSNMSILGRYILSPAIFSHLEKASAGAGGEIQLTDSMVSLLKEEAFEGLIYSGKMYDCGSKAGFIEANLDLAYSRPDLRETVQAWLDAQHSSSVRENRERYVA